MRNQKVGSEQDARALTAEIDRATDEVVDASKTEGQRAESSENEGAGLERTRRRGERILGHSRVGNDSEIVSSDAGRVLDTANDWGSAGSRVEGVLDTRAVVDREAVELRHDTEELVHETTELIDDEGELTEAQNFVGEETPLQVRERLAADREDYLTEIGKGSPRDFKIMTANAERLTDEAVTAVQHLIKEEAVHPANLAHIKHEMTVALLKDAYSRVFGDRN